MPNTRSTNAVRLEFASDSLVQTNLSGAAFTDDWLWVAGDEACGIDRLRRLAPVGNESLRFGEVRDFPLSELLDLPGAAEDEADLEGMAVADGFLWVVGSHGLKRKSAKPDRDHADNASASPRPRSTATVDCWPVCPSNPTRAANLVWCAGPRMGGKHCDSKATRSTTC